MPIAIVGGGISGLAAAYRLQQAGVAVTLLEASGELGGKARTQKIGPYTIEVGADSFVASRPRIIELCRELGIESDLIAPPRVTHAAYIRHRGHRYPMPAGFTGLIPTKLLPTFRSRLLTPAGKVRLALEPAIPTDRGIQDESVEHFVIRRFGREAYIRLFEPLLTGISSSDGTLVSLEASFPAWKTAELE
jgi:oxygen-dependent protoporphyrinogen oxidase